MTDQIARATGLSQSIQAAVQVENLDERLLANNLGDKTNQYTAELYQSLKQKWEVNSAMTSAEVIEHLRNFAAADGVVPYTSVRTHSVTLAQILRMLKDDGEASSSISEVLTKGIGFSVVANGFLDSFIVDMIKLPEELDSW